MQHGIAEPARPVPDPLDFQAVASWLQAPLPPAVDRKLRLLMLDSYGCIAAGLRAAEVGRLGAALAVLFPGAAALPGAPTGLGPAGLAALAATAMCWDEANEGLAEAHGRPGLSVIPCALALGAGRPMEEVLRAVALGYEIGARAGQAWRIRPGMHVDGSWHSLGAAATCAALLGADPLRAVRLAACQVPFSLFLPLAAGMTGRNTYPAHAALLGALCAAASLAGSDAPPGALAEARTLALAPDGPAAPAPAGTWLVLDAYTKPYAGVRHGHYAAAAAAKLRPVAPAAITEIRVETYAEALHYAANRAPRTRIAAQFSLSFAAAAGLRWGELMPEAYDSLDDPGLVRLERLVELRADPALPGRAARVSIRTAEGWRTAQVDGVPGDPGQPMEEAEITAKVRRLAGAGPDTDRLAGMFLRGGRLAW